MRVKLHSEGELRVVRDAQVTSPERPVVRELTIGAPDGIVTVDAVVEATSLDLDVIAVEVGDTPLATHLFDGGAIRYRRVIMKSDDDTLTQTVRNVLVTVDGERMDPSRVRLTLRAGELPVVEILP